MFDFQDYVLLLC